MFSYFQLFSQQGKSGSVVSLSFIFTYPQQKRNEKQSGEVRMVDPSSDDVDAHGLDGGGHG